jgi:hypothetical protein
MSGLAPGKVRSLILRKFNTYFLADFPVGGSLIVN